MGDTEQTTNLIAARRNPFSASLAPLEEPLFRGLWMAAVLSYTGTWMQNVGVGWLMTTLTADPFMVGLVQAAISLPVFLIILPAGALADIVDRRRLLLATQTWMALTAAALGVLTLFGLVTPWLLLLFTFVLGLGMVMNDPAWQAITPEVVSPPQLASAIALNSAGFNIARAVGPALGGLLIAAAAYFPGPVPPEERGSGFVFLLNALSFSGVILFLYRWRRVPHHNPNPTDRVMTALRDGFRYARQASEVHAVIVRTAVFSFGASALLALLPLIGRPFGSLGYGTLLASFGLGAMAGAATGPWVRHHVSVDKLAMAATALFAAAMAAVGATAKFPLLMALMLAAGMGWIHILTALNVCAQTSAPIWVRARTISMYLLVLQGGIAAGSALWGAVAARLDIAHALWYAATSLLVGLLVIPRFRLHDIESAWRGSAATQ
jgi:MFS family permease